MGPQGTEGCFKIDAQKTISKENRDGVDSIKMIQGSYWAKAAYTVLKCDSQTGRPLQHL